MRKSIDLNQPAVAKANARTTNSKATFMYLAANLKNSEGQSNRLTSC